MGSWGKRETIERWSGTTTKSAKADSWDSWYKDRRNVGKTASGYDGQAGVDLGKEVHTQERLAEEPRLSFNELPNRGRTYGSTRGRGNSSSNTTGKNRPRGPTKMKGGSTGRRPTRTNNLCDTQMRLGEVILQVRPTRIKEDLSPEQSRGNLPHEVV